MVKPSSRLEDELKEEVDKIGEEVTAEPQAVVNDLLENQGESNRFLYVLMWSLPTKYFMIVFSSLAQIINVAIRAEYEVAEVVLNDLMTVLCSEFPANAPRPAER